MRFDSDYISMPVLADGGATKTVLFSPDIPRHLIAQATTFEPLRLHLERLDKEGFSDALLHIESVMQFPNDQVGLLYTRTTYKNPLTNDASAYGYIITYDGADNLPLFKVTASAATARNVEGYQGNGYYVLTVVEPRVAIPDQARIGVPAGLANAGESGADATGREFAEETRLKPPVTAFEPIELKTMNAWPIMSRRVTVNVSITTLDLDTPAGLDYWNSVAGAGNRAGNDMKGGFEATRTVMMRAGDYISNPHTTADFREGLWEIAAALSAVRKPLLLDELLAARGTPLRRASVLQLRRLEE